MKWEGEQESENVEDTRGLKPVAAAGGGIGVLVLMAAVYFFTGDPNAARQAGQVAKQFQGQRQAQQGEAAPINDEAKKLVGKTLLSTEKVWDEQFRRMGREYEKPRLKLFSTEVNTGCGTAPSAVGPFYCPADKYVYLDPTFFDELQDKLGGSKADFSQTYVVAHEVGHHVQNLLGYNRLVDQYERKEGKNAGVRLELQADYLAGCWAFYAQQLNHFTLDRNDIESALTTANAIGDDRLQKRSQGWVSPEGFTHGSSAQRIKFFKQGFQTGDLSKKKLDAFFDPNVNPLEL